MLGAARLLQGVGSAFSWAGALAWLVAAAPRERSGALIGTTMGAAVFGALFGPVIGAIASGRRRAADLRRRRPARASALGRWVACHAGSAGAAAAVQGALRRADRRLLGGMWLLVLPALLFGVVAVLVPLRLHDAGWGGVAIGAVFLATAALETVLNPLLGPLHRPPRLAACRCASRWSARRWSRSASPGRGRLRPWRALVLMAGLAYGGFYTPGMTLLTDAAERRGISAALAFGAMNGAWAAGNVVGPAVGGWLAELAGDALPYLLLASVCLVSLVATWRVVPRQLQPSSRPSSP